MIRLKKMFAALAVLGLLVSLTASVPAGAKLIAQDKDKKPKKDKKEKKEKDQDKSDQSATPSDRELRNMLWSEPTNIESLDLFNGPEGAAGAPDPQGKFTFEKRDTGGTSEKIHVTDDKGRKWNVKFGAEVKPETAASRIAWAAGYHVDQNYFVKRTHIEGRGGFDIWDVRFKRRDDGTKNVGLWSWHANPFLGTRELQGYKVLMVLLNNWDLKEENNKIIRASKKSGGDGDARIYYVSDLGGTLGATGNPFRKIPGFSSAPAGSKGNPTAYAGQVFIEGVKNGQVVFHYEGKDPKAVEGITVENARWMGDLLGRLSDKQLGDAFRAGGFAETEVNIYVKAMRGRIDQLKNLK